MSRSMVAAHGARDLEREGFVFAVGYPAAAPIENGLDGMDSFRLRIRLKSSEVKPSFWWDLPCSKAASSQLAVFGNRLCRIAGNKGRHLRTACGWAEPGTGDLVCHITGGQDQEMIAFENCLRISPLKCIFQCSGCFQFGGYVVCPMALDLGGHCLVVRMEEDYSICQQRQEINHVSNRSVCKRQPVGSWTIKCARRDGIGAFGTILHYLDSHVRRVNGQEFDLRRVLGFRLPNLPFVHQPSNGAAVTGRAGESVVEFKQGRSQAFDINNPSQLNQVLFGMARGFEH